MIHDAMEQHDYFNLFHPIDASKYALFRQRLKKTFFKKGDFITVAGEVQRRLYFVKSGVQMSYFHHDDKKHVIAFTYSPNVCAIPESFQSQTPSTYFLTCLTDSEMDYMTFEALHELFNQSPPLERLFRRMTEAVLAGFINRHMELHSKTIEERYKAFCQRSPHLLGVVPHKYIASYLAIDPTNFSKLFNSVQF